MAYPQYEKDASQAERQRDEDRVMAMASGTLNVPLDAVRYPGLIANWVMEKTGIRNEEQANAAADAINAFADRPPVLSDEVNDKRQQLAEDHPLLTSVGEVAGATGVAKGLLKRSVNLKKNGKRHVYQNRLTGTEAHTPAAYYGTAAGYAAFDEAAGEDAIQAFTGHYDEE